MINTHHRHRNGSSGAIGVRVRRDEVAHVERRGMWRRIYLTCFTNREKKRLQIGSNIISSIYNNINTQPWCLRVCAKRKAQNLSRANHDSNFRLQICINIRSLNIRNCENWISFSWSLIHHGLNPLKNSLYDFLFPLFYWTLNIGIGKL